MSRTRPSSAVVGNSNIICRSARPLRRLCTLALLRLLTCGVLAEETQRVETFKLVKDASVESDHQMEEASFGSDNLVQATSVGSDYPEEDVGVNIDQDANVENDLQNEGAESDDQLEDESADSDHLAESESVEGGYFSLPWLDKYDDKKAGCGLGRGSYTWRKHGLGSNINNMLNAWVYFLAVKEWNDLSLICDDLQFQGLHCFDESDGLVSQGWGCLFSSMPHLCVFDKAKAWTNHMIAANVSTEDQNATSSLDLTTIRKLTGDTVNSLQDFDIDHMGALAVMAKYMWSYMTPWFRNDVDFVTHAEKAVNGSPFLGLHVRRGDKLRGEAHAVAVEDYLKAAVGYIEEQATPKGVSGIEAIWVASDDPAIVDEVRSLAPAYFPNVEEEAIVYVADGVAGGSNTTGVDTHTRTQGYGSFVYIIADIEQLAAADVFVGTFSSNVGRLVAVLREGLGKPRDSSISLDAKAWYPGRNRGLLLE